MPVPHTICELQCSLAILSILKRQVYLYVCFLLDLAYWHSAVLLSISSTLSRDPHWYALASCPIWISCTIIRIPSAFLKVILHSILWLLFKKMLSPSCSTLWWSLSPRWVATWAGSNTLWVLPLSSLLVLVDSLSGSFADSWLLSSHGRLQKFEVGFLALKIEYPIVPLSARVNWRNLCRYLGDPVPFICLEGYALGYEIISV